jgi:SAM-dependent methyltransferase
MRLSDVTVAGKFYIRRWLGKSSGKRVLDVGSGHRPHEDATHLIDLLPEDDSERGKPIKRLGRPLVLGTIEALPFKDQTFDYIYASHVLEHTVDPAAACNELMRVARAGYVETPSPFYEQGYNYPHPERGWSFHRWFVFLGENNTLIFEPKTRGTIDQFCDCRYAHFVKGIYTSVPDLNQIHHVLPHECNNTVLRWTGRFNLQVREVPHVGCDHGS